jgi:hypothetical protein
MKEKLHRQINKLIAQLATNGQDKVPTKKVIAALQAIQREIQDIQEIPLDVDAIHWEDK